MTATGARQPATGHQETGDPTLPAEFIPKPKPVKLTKPRAKALVVLADRHSKGRSARVSNVTDLEDGLVYWQCAEWLVTQGLAAPIREGGTYLRITPAGLEQLR